ncbi:hypothetical protein ACFSHQ_00215 [Gemmobacter lanyuensis]
MMTEHVITRWHGNGATVRDMLTGAEETVAASALVMATTNMAFDPFPKRYRARCCTESGIAWRRVRPLMPSTKAARSRSVFDALPDQAL